MKDERTLKMVENYAHHFFDEGMSPKEIAEKYNLSSGTVYGSLSEIASNLGVTREELLKRPHDEHIMGVRNFAPVKKVDVSFFRSSMEEFEKNMISLDDFMSRAIEEHEELSRICMEENR